MPCRHPATAETRRFLRFAVSHETIDRRIAADVERQSCNPRFVSDKPVTSIRFTGDYLDAADVEENVCHNEMG